MSKFLDTHPNDLIDAVAIHLEKENIVEPPVWSQFVKTGIHKERQPQQENWWYLRSASILRKLYKHGPLGVSKLRGIYGGRKNNGHAPEHHVKAGGKVIRTILIQLEEKNLVRKDEKGGRSITKQGEKLLADASKKAGKQNN